MDKQRGEGLRTGVWPIIATPGRAGLEKNAGCAPNSSLESFHGLSCGPVHFSRRGIAFPEKHAPAIFSSASRCRDALIRGAPRSSTGKGEILPAECI